MNRTSHRFWLVIVCLAAILALPGMAIASAALHPLQQSAPDPTGDWQRVQSDGKIVFGTAADYPPFEFYNSNFELDGFDIALARAIGDELGVDVEFKDFAFDGLIGAVQLGQVDAAIGAISVTPERQQVVDFTNLYYIGNSVVLAKTSFTATVTSATDLADLRVGVQRGSTYQQWAQRNLVDKGLVAQDDLVPYSTPSEMIRALRNGSIDASLLGQATAELAEARNDDLHIVGVSFNQQQFAIAAPNGS
ncbi:MAG: ABC transporter substrate-binding protein, partial [Caldilinea sp.]